MRPLILNHNNFCLFTYILQNNNGFALAAGIVFIN